MTPASSEQAAERATPHDLAAEQRVLGALLIDREYGLLRWAPVVALALTYSCTSTPNARESVCFH